MSAAKRQALISGIVICVLGAICFSTKAIFVKLAYRDTDIDPVSLLALRMIFSLPFFVVSASISSSRRDNVKFTPSEWIYIAVIGCLGYYISSLLDFLGLQFISAGIERLILFTYPTLALIFTAIFFQQKIKTFQWIAVAISYVGLTIAFLGEINDDQFSGKNFYYGALLIFGCSITYALYIVGSGRLIPRVGAAKFNSYAMTFAALGVVTHFYFVSSNSLLNLDPLVYVYSLCMAVVSTVIPSYLVTEGIKRVGAENAAIIGSVGPVSTIAQAFIFLGEPILLLQVIGTILVLAGVLMIGKKNSEELVKE